MTSTLVVLLICFIGARVMRGAGGCLVRMIVGAVVGLVLLLLVLLFVASRLGR